MIKEYLNHYKKEFKRCFEDLKHKETIYKQIPNMITITRPLGMIPANILFFTGNIIPAIILTAILLSTDFIDGKLARKWNVQSKLGADLDAVGDKILFFGLAIPIVVSNPIMLLNILLEVAIASTNVIGRMKGLDTKTLYSGKVKTCILSLTLIIGYITQFFNIPSFILKTLITITLGSQAVTLVNYLQKNKELEINKELYNSPDNKEDILEEQLDNKVPENKIEALKKEKEFLLSINNPEKTKTAKKKTRKKNN